MAKNKIIPIIGVNGLIGVMLLALLTLLGIQWYWVQNAVALKEAEFNRKVDHALVQVAERLQDREAAGIIQTDFMTTHSPNGFQYRIHDDSVGRRKMRVVRQDIRGPGPGQDMAVIVTREMHATTEDGMQVTVDHQLRAGPTREHDSEEIIVIASDTSADIEILHKRKHEYLERLMTRVLMPKIPIAERIRQGEIDSMIRWEFAHNGIHDAFTYQVQERPLSFTWVSDGRSPNTFLAAGKPDDAHAVRLFPHDLQPSEDFLIVEFPDRKNPTVQAMGLLLPTSGVLVLVVVLCFGLTLFALQRQKKLSELKTDFINNMTHELKTPISTISLALQALKDPDMQKPGMVDRYARIIGEENNRLQSHVEQVLQAAASEEGSLRLEFVPVDANVRITQEVNRLRLHVEERGGQITFASNATDPVLQADAVHFSGIIRNLLDNANKYSPESPQIQVTTSNEGGGLRITIADQGQGMSRETQKHIFEKFYRKPQGNVHDVKGFGLGLSYVMSMVKAHRGTIKVDSEAGKGARFEVWLPHNPQQA